MSSSVSSTDRTDDAIRYGNLRAPGLPGLGRLSFGASIFLVFAAVILMILGLVNIVAAGVWAVLAVAIAAPAAFPTKDSYGRYELLGRRWKATMLRRSGKAELEQGLTGRVPDGQCRLPGVAAATQLSSHVDMHGRPFALIHWPHGNLYSVVIACAPAGFAGLDRDVKDNMVAHWAAWIGQLNTVEEIVGAAVVVETVPDSGQRLDRAMDRGRAEDSAVPPFARLVEDQLRSTLRVGSPTTGCWLTLTLTARAMDSDQGAVRSREDMADQIGDLIPGWTSSLAQTGAGTATRACTAQEVVDFTRVAFDPSVANDVEEARLAAAAGDGDGTGLVWEQAGPISHHLESETYLHESTFSRTWQMRTPPRGVFFAETLQAMLSPHRDIPRKRVTQLFRPETPETSATAADADVRKATFKATQGSRVKAGAKSELRSAEVTADQEAQGSPLVRVGMLITVSTGDEASLRRASRAVKSGLAAQARIGLRIPRGSQDMAFLTGLPLGLVPQLVTQFGRKGDSDLKNDLKNDTADGRDAGKRRGGGRA